MWKYESALKYLKFIIKILVIRFLISEMQIKTTERYHLTQVRMTIIKSLQITNAGEDVKKREPSYTVVGMSVGAATVDNTMEVP